MFDPTHGVITFNNVTLPSLTSEELVNLVSIAHQIPYVWNDTIESNIRLGNPTASEDEMSKLLIKLE